MGSLDTWFKVTSAGLEEGFTLKAPPTKSSKALAIDLGSAANWKVGAGGTSLVTTDSHGRAPITFGGLRSLDANGRVLHSYFSITNNSVEVVVDDSGATFPVTVDPTWTTSSSPTATLTSGGATGDAFGYSVAMSADGTTALIGANGVSSYKGAAYIFHVSGEGSWTTSSTPTATLTNSGGASNDYFGYSVAMSADGTTALIGAFGVSSYTGAAYIFHVSGEGSWATLSSPTATLTSGGAAYDQFGISVAMSADGTTALIGANGVSSYTGAAYIFHVSGEGSWATSSSPTATLTNSGGASGDLFGYSVAMSADGTTALIGANGVSSYTGAAYIFHVSGEGSWATMTAPTATLTNSAGAAYDQFGISVAMSADGTTALIGANGVSSYTGAAYIFHVSGEGSWATSSTPTATLTSGGAANDYFGYSVAISADGTTALIGAAGVSSYTGAAYIFHVAGEGSWSTATLTSTLTNGGGASGDQFGYSVAMSADGTTALIGAYGVSSSTGAAYVYQSGATPPPTVTSISPTSGPTGGGTSVTVAGTNFTGATAVDFGATAGTSFTVTSSASITVTSPAEAAGTVDITVTTSGGTSGISSADQFTYVSPPPPSPTPTATALTASPTTVSPSGNVAISVTVTSGSGSPSGTVTIDNGSSALTGCIDLPIGNAGTVSCTTSFATSGTYSLSATFNGTSLYSPSTSSPITVTVGSTPPTTTPPTTTPPTTLPPTTTPPTTTPPTTLPPTCPAGESGTPPNCSAKAGYWVVSAAGKVTPEGTARSYGDVSGMHLDAPIIQIQSTPSGMGYWLLGQDGGIFTEGDAQFYGAMGGKPLNARIVSMAPTPSGKGYWLVGSDGGVFTFGDAVYYGSTYQLNPGMAPGGKNSAAPLNKPVVGIVATADGKGYWEVASDGGVLTFGDAVFQGSTGSTPLAQPVVGLIPANGGAGYIMVAKDGGVFTFCGAGNSNNCFFGSPSGHLTTPNSVVGIASTPTGMGYFLAGSDGTVYGFGDATSLASSSGSSTGASNVVGVSAMA